MYIASQEHINSFVRPALADMEGESDFQYVYVSGQSDRANVV